MTLRTFFALFIIFCNSNIYSQRPGGYDGPPINGTITGKILGEPGNKPVEYANIVLHKMKDSTIVNGTISDSTGRFKIENLRPGFYYVEVMFLGCDKYISKPFKITPQDYNIDLGNIEIKPSRQAIGEVEVVADKPLIEFSLDKKIVHVDKNLTATGGSAVDIMRNVPSIEVDVDGNVSLRGSSNINFLIDGKPSLLSGDNRTAILEQLPASSIERIEIITNPSAKYDPDGMSGIINIITKKQKAPGYNGMISAGIDSKGSYNGSLVMNYRVNKINLFASYDFRYNDRTGSRIMDRETYLNDTTSYLHQYTKNIHTSNSNNIKAGIDYQLNKLNSITLSGTFRAGENPGKSFTNYLEQDYLKNLTDLYYRTESEGGKDHSIEGNLNYRKSFEKKEKELTADFYFSKEYEDETETYFQKEEFLQGINDINQTANTINNNYFLSGQTDYVHPFGKRQRLETGYKATIENSDNDYYFYNYSDSISDWLLDTNLANNFIYNAQIHSAYLIYSNEFSLFSLQAGIRAEQAFITADQITMNETYKNDYFNIFPSAHFSYNFNETNKIQLSYSRRINRPDMHALNPFIDAGDPNIIRYGNPELKPEYINAFEIGHIKDWKKISLTSSLFYRQISNIISRYHLTTTDGLFAVTFANLNSGRSYGAEFVVTGSLAKWWKVNADFSYYKTEVDATNLENELTNSNYSWNSKLNSNMFLPNNFSIQIMGTYNGPSVTAQGTRKEVYFIDAGLKKDFFKRKLSATLRFSDILNSRQFRMESGDDTYHLNATFRRDSRFIILSLSYKINEGIKQREKRQMDSNFENNMDIGL